MKLFDWVSFRHIILGCVLLAQEGLLAADEEDQGSLKSETDAAVPVVTETSQAEFMQALTQSRHLLEKDQGDAAEAKLADHNRAKSQSVGWHLTQVANLLRIAFAAKETGDEKTAQRAARRALAHLTQAENKPGLEATEATAISSLRAFIKDRLDGDTNQAEQELRKVDAQKNRSQ